MARIFDDLKRSTGYEKLAQMRAHGLLTQEELLTFSAHTRGVLDLLLGC